MINNDVIKKYCNKEVQKHLFMLKKDSQEFVNLTKKQKLVILHLVRASDWVQKAYFRMQNNDNIKFFDYLNKEISNGNNDAKIVFDFFKHMRTAIFIDSNGDKVKIFDDAKETGWLNFYPQDLTCDEFHKILNDMLDKNLIDEVQKMLTQHTMVIRNGEYLKGIEYVDYFPELQECAKELRLAIKYSDDLAFNEFLEYQAKALCENNQEYDCQADILWAKLDSNIIDFTLTRESYDDTMTESIFANNQLLERLKNFDIIPIPKDLLGARVGIRNLPGTKFLHDISELANVIKENIPYTNTNKNKNINEGEMLDLDIVCMCGGESVGGRCTLAQVLPNDDKLSAKRGGAKKKVYNRQVRMTTIPESCKYFINKKDLEYFNCEAMHYATICHETTHTFGPQKVVLGKYTSIIEEEKADLGMFAFLDKMIQANIFDEKTCREIVVTELMSNFRKSKPLISEAHSVERIMILHKMIMNKAVYLGKDNMIYVDYESVIKNAKDLMSEVIDIQISADVSLAKKHLDKYFVWDDVMQYVAEVLKKHSKYLCAIFNEPLKDYLMTQTAEKELLGTN